MAEVGPRRVRGAMAAGSVAVLARALEALGEGAGRGPGGDLGVGLRESWAYPGPRDRVCGGALPPPEGLAGRRPAEPPHPGPGASRSRRRRLVVGQRGLSAGRLGASLLGGGLDEAA